MLAFLNGIVSKRTGPQDGEAQGASSICDPLCTGSRSNHWKRIRARTEPIIVSMTPGSAGWYNKAHYRGGPGPRTGYMELQHGRAHHRGSPGPRTGYMELQNGRTRQTWWSHTLQNRRGSTETRHTTGAVQGPEQGTWNCNTVGHTTGAVQGPEQGTWSCKTVGHAHTNTMEVCPPEQDFMCRVWSLEEHPGAQAQILYKYTHLEEHPEAQAQSWCGSVSLGASTSEARTFF